MLSKLEGDFKELKPYYDTANDEHCAVIIYDKAELKEANIY